MKESKKEVKWPTQAQPKENFNTINTMSKMDFEPDVVPSKQQFVFKEPTKRTNWRTIDSLWIQDIRNGDIRSLIAAKDELAHSNFLDPMFVQPTKQGKKAIQCM